MGGDNKRAGTQHLVCSDGEMSREVGESIASQVKSQYLCLPSSPFIKKKPLEERFLVLGHFNFCSCARKKDGVGWAGRPFVWSHLIWWHWDRTGVTPPAEPSSLVVTWSTPWWSSSWRSSWRSGSLWRSSWKSSWTSPPCDIRFCSDHLVSWMQKGLQ